MKKCNKCNETKELTEFSIRKDCKLGREPKCKTCRGIQGKIYRHSIDGVVTTTHKTQRFSSTKRGHEEPEYDRGWLKQWMLSQPHFEELYQVWAGSGYDTELRPSVDRIRDDIGYTRTNIQLMTWADNKSKSYQGVRSGAIKHSNKPVEQYDTHGNFITTYHSISEAKRQTSICHIGSVCMNSPHRRTAGGFVWRYAS